VEHFLQYDYMWDCNQTHLIAMGRLLALLVQLGHVEPTSEAGKIDPAMVGAVPRRRTGWERTRADIDQFERDLYEMIDRYVQDDGSSNEGIGYWGGTFRITLARAGRSGPLPRQDAARDDSPQDGQDVEFPGANVVDRRRAREFPADFGIPRMTVCPGMQWVWRPLPCSSPNGRGSWLPAWRAKPRQSTSTSILQQMVQ